MPHIGEIRKGREIGRDGTKQIQSCNFIWHACPDCGKERWINFRKGGPSSKRCRDCQLKAIHTPEVRNNISKSHKALRRICEKSSHWKGGKRKMTDGYIIIKLHPDDFFYPMTNSVGLVREHRLIMAQFLRRCLLPWEIVHHKGTKYPSGSIENRSDNRLENLELIKGDTRHLPYTALVRNNNKLRQRIEYLEAENAGLKSQNQ